MNLMDTGIAESETIEDLGRGGFSLIQKKTGFRYGEDTVFLSFFAAQTMGRKRRRQKAAELGEVPRHHGHLVLLGGVFAAMLAGSVLAVSFSSVFYILLGGVIGLTVYGASCLKKKGAERK